ncbi:MAG: hypothetical protein IJZ39_07000 [Oscillospiraceae bacterium]|nr:hypothetical protein [Oscillospiraceae bacterium]
MNIWKIASVALTIVGGILGMAAELADSRNLAIEAREEAHDAAIDEVHRMFAVNDNNQNEEEV